MYPVPDDQPIPSIVELNRDVEPFIIQASGGRNQHFKDPYKVLQFVHFTDVHHMIELWNRMVEYVNTYSEFIHFALHTGDYCGCSHTEYYRDLYGMSDPCVRPILNCVGNHDTIESYAKRYSTAQETYPLIYPQKVVDSWGATFQPGEYTMSYYKDFPESNLRLLVIDFYFGDEDQLAWLRETLEDARQKGLHVITAGHEMTHPIVRSPDVTFRTADDFFFDLGRKPKEEREYDHIIAEFKEKGGVHVCHLAGNEHAEYFGFTEHGVLNVVAPATTHKIIWSDCQRVRGTKTYDCFNVVAVDTNLKLLKMVRVGNNADHFLRRKRLLCWDYGKQELVYND